MKRRIALIAAMAMFPSIDGQVAESWFRGGGNSNKPKPKKLLPLSEYELERVNEHRRQLYDSDSSSVSFEDECYHQTLENCKLAIQLANMLNPAWPDLHIITLHTRTSNDIEYFKIVITMDKDDESKAVGVVGNGLIHYPFDFMVCDENNESSRLEIGLYGKQMWDCEVGTALSFEACCAMIKESLLDDNGNPHEDCQGNTLECHEEFPIGSPSNPFDPSRVIVVVNDENKVVNEPRIE